MNRNSIIIVLILFSLAPLRQDKSHGWPYANLAVDESSRGHCGDEVCTNPTYTYLKQSGEICFHEGCHAGQEKRKKRSAASGADTTQTLEYFAACLEETVGDTNSYNWTSNVVYTILYSKWFLNTNEVVCSSDAEYNNSACWSTEIEQYLNDDDLLPFVKTCIEHFYVDYATTPPQPRYPSSTVKRSLSMQRIQNPPDPNRLNSDYISCIENANTTLNVNFRKLLGAIERHSVLRKCNSAFQTRPLSYRQKFLSLTLPNKEVRRAIESCNKRRFPEENSWSFWSQWSQCEPECSGTQNRTRLCFNGNRPRTKFKSTDCSNGSDTEIRECNTGYACWSDWSSWTECSKTCGIGRRFRWRTCNVTSLANCSLNCAGDEEQSENCNTGNCPCASPPITMIACEGFLPLTVQCGGTSYINVIEAYYGRTNSLTCGYNIDTNCVSQISSDIIRRRCQGRTSCRLIASSFLFGNPCQGVVKYIEIKYECTPLPSFTAFTCEWQHPVQASCPDGYAIQVIRAFYGRRHIGMCGCNRFTTCEAQGSQDAIKTQCEMQRSCVLVASSVLFGNPCSDVTKYAVMNYRCVPFDASLTSVNVSEGENRTIACPNDKTLLVTEGFYGIDHNMTCSEGNETRCRSLNATYQLKTSCNFKSSCLLQANSGVYGDPCVGTRKHLQAKYACVQRWRT